MVFKPKPELLTNLSHTRLYLNYFFPDLFDLFYFLYLKRSYVDASGSWLNASNETSWRCICMPFTSFIIIWNSLFHLDTWCCIILSFSFGKMKQSFNRIIENGGIYFDTDYCPFTFIFLNSVCKQIQVL